MMCVFRRFSAAGSAVLVWPLSPPLFVLAPYTDGVAYLDWVDQSSGRITSTAAALVSSTNWIVLGARRDGDRSVWSVNGADIASGTLAALRYGPTASAALTIGGYLALALHGNCQIAELKIWGGSLTPDERAAQVDALRTKYAI